MTCKDIVLLPIVMATFLLGVVCAQAPSITAQPNPIYVPSGQYGSTTISYDAPGVQAAHVLADGALFCAGGSVGVCLTGEWVHDGMIFTLVNSGTGQVLATVTVNVIVTALSCTGLAPGIYSPVAPGAALTFYVNGVQNAVAVELVVKHHTGSTTSYGASPSGTSGQWSGSVVTQSLPLGGYMVSPLLRAADGTIQACSAESFFSLLTPLDPPNPGQVACTNFAGSWTIDIFPNTGTGAGSMGERLLLNISQNGNQLTGNAQTTSPGCFLTSWSTVTGSMGVPGNVLVVATNGSNQCGPTVIPADSLELTGFVRFPTCKAVDNIKVVSKYQGGSAQRESRGVLVSGPTVVPSAETSEFALWNESVGRVTEALFKGRLTGQVGYSFGGRIVQEGDGPGGTTDGCYFPFSEIDPITGITGGFWYVQRDGTYSHDHMGMAPATVGYYQRTRPRYGYPPSCDVTVSQKMEILTETAVWTQYAVNPVTLTVKPSTFEVKRANASASRPFSF